MNNQELINEINKTKEHLANMEKMLAECEYERWKPERDESYWYIAIDGSVEQHINVNHWVDKCHFKTLNYFKTREQAEAEAEKILVRRMLEDIAKRLNRGEKINWKDIDQSKYSFYLDYVKNELFDSTSYATKKRCGTIYCLSSDFKNVAIQEIGEERLKKYLRGE